jgi:hypothetical protein
LKIIRRRIPASITSVGRNISADDSGTININCIDSGTKKTVKIRNLSMANNARRPNNKAAGRSQRSVASLLKMRIETATNVIVTINAQMGLMFSPNSTRKFGLLFIFHH